MASDISSIIQGELVNTFDSLLSLKSSVQEVVKQQIVDVEDNEYIKITIDLKFSNKESSLIIYLPNQIASKFEYLMLGGIGDIKQEIDEEIIDAVKEIIATVGGGLSTTIKAQNFEDMNDFSFSLNESIKISSSDIVNDENLYKFIIKLDDDTQFLLMQFDNILLPFIDTISSGNKIEEESATETASSNISNLDSVLSILGENASDNLKLLFDVQLKFSVRLGKKTFLLKDIVNWDIGQIIELEQMVNEPLDLLINNVKIGVGEAVIVEGKFGIKVKYIGEEN